MSSVLQTALIALLAAIIVSAISTYLIWNQMQREQPVEVVTKNEQSTAVRLFDMRLATYPQMVQLMGNLSEQRLELLTEAECWRIATTVDQWLYDTGGFCAEQETRAALRTVAQLCREWHARDDVTALKAGRDDALLALRRDIGVIGLEAGTPRSQTPPDS